MGQASRFSILINGRPWLLLYVLGTVLAVSWAMGPQEVVFSAEDDRRVRGYTRYSELCLDTLLPGQELGLGQCLARIASLIVERTRDETILSSSTLHQLEGVQKPRQREAAAYCVELMEMSLGRLNQSLKALRYSSQKNKYDIQTWLSAVLTFHDSCKDAVSDLPSVISSKIFVKMDHLSALASEALVLANRIPDGERAWNSSPQASEEIFPTWVSRKDRELLGGARIRADAVVAKDGSGDYTSIAAAVNGAPSSRGRTVILVKAGVYNEKLNVGRADVTLAGEGKDSTVITYNASVGGDSTMPASATVAVTGDRFIAVDIGFENSAGPRGLQALALRVASDMAVLYRCSLRGYQDTLYAHALRQFYRDCDIYGTVDFVFGNAAAVFQNCSLFLRRPSRGGSNTIMANGRTDLAQNTGFVAQRCRIAASSEIYRIRQSVRSYLGRPWKLLSRAVIMESSIDDSIQPRGWLEWSGGFALDTLYFAEYLNTGPGAATSSRVDWPGFHVLGAGEASQFTVSSFIQGDSWLPSTSLIYDPGL